jgi:hypothetical protein
LSVTLRKREVRIGRFKILVLFNWVEVNCIENYDSVTSMGHGVAKL